jgi:hypothetical protein
MNSGKMVKADLYQLSRINGNNFSRETKVLKAKGVIVPLEYAEDVTRSWITSGKIYEIDEEGTKEFEKENSKRIKARKAQKEFEKLNSANALKDILGMAASQVAPAQPLKVSNDLPELDTDSTPNEDSSIEEIKSYLDANDIKYHHKLTDKTKLLELI